MRGAVIAAVVVFGAAGSTGDAAPLVPSAARAHLVFASDRDGDFDVYGASADGRRIAALTRNRADDTDVVVSPAGGWLALRRSFDQGVLVRADGRDERKLTGAPTAFSPDSRWLAVHRSRTDSIDLVRVGGRGVRHLGSGNPVGFSPTGRLLAFTADRGDGLVDLVTGRRTMLDDGDAQDFSVPLFSPHWRRFVYATESDDDDTFDLVVRDVARPRSSRQVLAHGDFGLDGIWLDDDRLAISAYVDGDVELRVFDVPARSSRRIARGESLDPVWSPAHDRFAYVSAFASDNAEVVIADANGVVTNTIPVRTLVTDLAWSLTGRRLAVVTSHGRSSDILIVDPGATAPPARVAAGIRAAGEPRWSPDGSALAVNAGDILVVSTGGGPTRAVTRGGNNTIVGWMRGDLPANAPRPAPALPPEVGGTRGLASRGRVADRIRRPVVGRDSGVEPDRLRPRRRVVAGTGVDPSLRPRRALRDSERLSRALTRGHEDRVERILLRQRLLHGPVRRRSERAG